MPALLSWIDKSEPLSNKTRWGRISGEIGVCEHQKEQWRSFMGVGMPCLVARKISQGHLKKIRKHMKALVAIMDNNSV